MKRLFCFVSCMLLVFILSCSRRASVFRSERSDEGIRISQETQDILFYQVKPKSVNGKFERAGYIHPLYTLDGNEMTEEFPQDHPHHHGIYSAWHQILLDNERVADGWTGENISWQVTRTEISDQPGSIKIASELLWQVSSGTQKSESIVQEFVEIMVHESNADFRVIDYETRLVPVKEGIMIGGSNDEKGYGGFSLRLQLPDDIRFTAKHKEIEPQVVSVNAGPWMNFTGSFDGDNAPKSGIVVFCHPSNPGSPHPWILRRRKSMQNPAWPGRVPVGLGKEGVKLRYRIVIHKLLDEEAIEKLYEKYTRQ